MRTIGFLGLCAVVNAGCFGDFCEQFGLGADCPGAAADGGNGGGTGNGGDGAGPSGGNGGEGGGGPPPGCAPQDGMPIGPECGIFVEEGAGGTGSKESPFSTVLEAALAADPAVDEKSRIYICGSGTFTGAVNVAGGISIYGSLSCGQWTFSEGNTKPLLEGTANAPAVTIVGTGNSELLGLRIESATATNDGQSSIALLISQASVEIDHVELLARDGADGAEPDPPDGQLGQAMNGSTGAASGMTPAQAPGGMNAVCSVNGGSGGQGGTMPNGNGVDGNPGQGGVGAGTLGEGQNSVDGCTSGGNGANGVPGPFGHGASAPGNLTATGFVPATGEPGQPGTHGKGGGGGGGSLATAGSHGAGGGGGGAGGCGGNGGAAGMGGGSSIALLSFNATVTMTNDVTLSLGQGGNGGAGGGGQLRQNGGPPGSGGAAGAALQGCAGGSGGTGGHGGNGGGGRGGHAVAVAYVGVEPQGGDIVAGGMNGEGGVGGTNGGATPAGGIGEPGEVLTRELFEAI